MTPIASTGEHRMVAVEGFKRISEIYLAKDSGRSEQVNTANAVIATTVQLFSLQKPDINNPEEVLGSIQKYFEITSQKNTRPTITGLCVAMGLTRRQFHDICETGSYKKPRAETAIIVPPETEALLLAVREQFTSMLEGFMESNTIHPTAGMFLLKNNSDYKDVIERKCTITQANVDSEQLEKKYQQELSELE